MKALATAELSPADRLIEASAREYANGRGTLADHEAFVDRVLSSDATTMAEYLAELIPSHHRNGHHAGCPCDDCRRSDEGLLTKGEWR